MPWASASHWLATPWIECSAHGTSLGGNRRVFPRLASCSNTSLIQGLQLTPRRFITDLRAAQVLSAMMLASRTRPSRRCACLVIRSTIRCSTNQQARPKAQVHGRPAFAHPPRHLHGLTTPSPIEQGMESHAALRSLRPACLAHQRLDQRLAATMTEMVYSRSMGPWLASSSPRWPCHPMQQRR